MRKNRLFFIFCFIFFSSSLFAQTERTDIDTLKSNSYFYQGEASLNSGDFEMAEHYFKKALQFNFNNLIVYSGLAYIAYQNGEYTKSVEYSNRGLDVFENGNFKKNIVYHDLIKLKAYSLVLLGKDIEALAYLSEAINLDNTDFYNYYQRALACIVLGDFEQAYQDIRMADELMPNHSGVNSAYGILFFELSDYKNALKYLYKSNMLEQVPVNYFYIGLCYYYLFDFEKSIKNLETFLNHPLEELRIQNDEIEAKFYLGATYFTLGLYEKAIPYLKEYLENDALNTLVNYWYAYSFIGIDDLTKAELLLKENSLKFPDDGVFDKFLGDLYIHNSDTIKAKKHYASAIERGSSVVDTLEFFQEIAKGYIQLNDTLGVIRCWEKASKLLPNSSLVYRNLLRVYSLKEIQYFDEIKEVLDQLIEIYLETNKEKAAYYIAFKSVYVMSSGELDKAYKEINKAIEIHPFYEYYAMRGFLLFLKNTELTPGMIKIESLMETSDEILADIDKALQANRRKKDLYVLKTSLLLAFDRREEACESANEAISLGATIDKQKLKTVCEGKESEEGDNEWELSFYLSPFEELFFD